MARQTMQLHQPLASPSWLLPLNKRQPSGLQQFANSIMKESYSHFQLSQEMAQPVEKVFCRALYTRKTPQVALIWG
jgi:hypothetical protein